MIGVLRPEVMKMLAMTAEKLAARDINARRAPACAPLMGLLIFKHEQVPRATETVTFITDMRRTTIPVVALVSCPLCPL